MKVATLLLRQLSIELSGGVFDDGVLEVGPNPIGVTVQHLHVFFGGCPELVVGANLHTGAKCLFQVSVESLVWIHLRALAR